jgi:hypothetical protein
MTDQRRDTNGALLIRRATSRQCRPSTVDKDDCVELISSLERHGEERRQHAKAS